MRISTQYRQPAGRLHDQRLGQSPRARLLAEAAQVGAQQRRQRGVDDRRRGALVLTEGAHQIAGERDLDVRQCLLQELAEQALVRGVAVGVQQRDGDRLRLRLCHRACHRLRRPRVKGL